MNIKTQHLKKILDKQFKLANIDLKYEDCFTKKWKKFSCSIDKKNEWLSWTEKYLRRHYKWPKETAFVMARWVDHQYGLKKK